MVLATATQQDHASAVCKATCDQRGIEAMCMETCGQRGIEAVHPAGKFTKHKSAFMQFQ